MNLMIPSSPSELLAACGRADTAARLLARFGRPRPSLDAELREYYFLRRHAAPEVERDYLRLEPWCAPMVGALDDARRGSR